MSTELRRRIDKYELHQRLGQSHIAEVWKAFDTQLRRYVAIKFLHMNLPANADSMKRFISEADTIASLRHSNIVQVHDFKIFPSPKSGKALAYLVMEFVEGQSLTDYIHGRLHGKFPLSADVVLLFALISLAIDYAHQNGVIHGDIKPDNILLKKSASVSAGSSSRIGEPMLTDFGLAKLLGTPTNALIRGSLTTACYTSPEQAQGHTGNERSDLYSLGVILYEIFAGVPPFHGNRSLSLMMQHINALPTPPALINPNISPALSQVILSSLAKDPAERFVSASFMDFFADKLNAGHSIPTFSRECYCNRPGGRTRFLCE